MSDQATIFSVELCAFLRTLDVEVEELELGPGEALEVGLEVLAGQLVQRHDAEHRRLPHRGLNVVVRLAREHGIKVGDSEDFTKSLVDFKRDGNW